MTTFQGYAVQLQSMCGAKNLSRSRIRPLIALLEADARVESVYLEIQRARRRTKFGATSVERKYGAVLACIEKHCEKLMHVRDASSRRESFNEHLHVGAENELKGTTIVLRREVDGAPEEIGYGTLIASTAVEANLYSAVSDAFGKPGEKLTVSLPLAKLEVEGASGGRSAHSGASGMIEHIGGPLSVKDELYLPSRRAFRIFVQKLGETCGSPLTKGTAWVNLPAGKKQCVPLAAVLDAYNRALDALDPKHKAFKLQMPERPGRTWYVAVDKKLLAETQLNFEVPLRNVIARDFVQLFDPKGQKSKLLEACGKSASPLVREFFSAVTDGDKLAAFFALYQYVSAVKCYLHRHEARQAIFPNAQGMSDHEAKNQYEYLPKAPVNDVLRVAFTDTEKAAIAAVTTNGGRFASLCKRMTKDIKNCLATAGYTVQAPENGADFDFDANHQAVLVPFAGCRYRGETAWKYGWGPKQPCAHRGCWRPDGHPGGHGAAPDAERAYTGTGKPVPVRLHWVAGQPDPEPVILFEARAINSVLAVVGKGDDRDASEGFAALGSVQVLS